MSSFQKLGHHFICEFSECDTSCLRDNAYIRDAFVTATRDSGMTIVGEGSFAFMPHGFTYYLLLAESHASIHVWPEFAYCAVDLFSCNLVISVDDFLHKLKEQLGARCITMQMIERGYVLPCIENH